MSKTTILYSIVVIFIIGVGVYFSAGAGTNSNVDPTVSVDSLPVDTIAIDTLAVDSVSVDTIKVDSVD